LAHLYTKLYFKKLSTEKVTECLIEAIPYLTSHIFVEMTSWYTKQEAMCMKLIKINNSNQTEESILI